MYSILQKIKGNNGCEITKIKGNVMTSLNSPLKSYLQINSLPRIFFTSKS